VLLGAGACASGGQDGGAVGEQGCEACEGHSASFALLLGYSHSLGAVDGWLWVQRLVCIGNVGYAIDAAGKAATEEMCSLEQLLVLFVLVVLMLVLCWCTPGAGAGAGAHGGRDCPGDVDLGCEGGGVLGIARFLWVWLDQII